MHYSLKMLFKHAAYDHRRRILVSLFLKMDCHLYETRECVSMDKFSERLSVSEFVLSSQR